MDKFKKAFVCGWPVEHSKSPVIHEHWLKAYGLDGSYEKIAVAPEKFPAFINGIKAEGFTGGNVTIPHKETALQLADSLQPAAREIGAVNTLWFDEGKLTGENTDWIGFAENLNQNAPGWNNNASDKTAMIIGAGGAARGVLYALMKFGFGEIVVANRTISKAEILAEKFGDSITPVFLADADNAMDKADLLINTSSMGMRDVPALPTNLLRSISLMKPSAIVTDIVYSPLKTPLLAAAENHGLKVVDGLGMLLHQAEPGFEKWFGTRPEVTKALRDEVIKAMGRVI